MQKKKLLLHTCCAPCSTHVLETLKNEYDITIYYYNPNIYPKEEYQKRLANAQKIANSLNINLIEGNYSTGIWHEKAKGFESEPEGGKRCAICYSMRLENSALFAKHHGFDLIATTLTISPHKDSKLINKIGKLMAAKHSIDFLEKDFKKDNGFRKSIELSKQHDLYRQKYCGCEFSRR